MLAMERRPNSSQVLSRFLYSAATHSAVLVGIVAFAPACNPEDWRADIAMFAGTCGVLAWYARRMSRLTFEVTDNAFVERNGVHVKFELLLSAIDYLKTADVSE